MKLYIGNCLVFHFLLYAIVSCLGSEEKFNSVLGGSGTNVSAAMQDSSVSETDNFLRVRQMYVDFENKLKSLVRTTIKKGMPFVMREVYTRNLSTECLISLIQITGALTKTKLWAFQMLDASGKIPIGFFAGTLTSLGDYEECVGIDIHQPQIKIKGQYCVIEIVPPVPKWRQYMSAHFAVPELRNFSAPDTVMSFLSNYVHNFHTLSIKTALCSPTSCSKDDIEKLLQVVPDKLDLNWKVKVSRCETKESFEFSSIQIFLVYFFILIVIIVAIATVMDMILEEEFTERKNIIGRISKVMRCFSLRLNMKVLTAYTGPEENLRFVYGLMFISLIWTFPAYFFLNLNYDTSGNFIAALEMTTNVFYGTMTSKIYPYQTFFFLSAFVTTHNYMKPIEKNLCIWKYLFKAYWRYTPVYMCLIGLLMLAPSWSSGPSWMDYMNPVYTHCKENWWTNLLYINNYVYTDKMCLAHGWFFAVAAQLHLIALVVLIPLKWRPKVGHLANLTLIGGSLLAVFFTNIYNKSPPSEIMSFLNTRDRLHYANQTYHRAYYHLVVYCCGIFAGYLTVTKPNMKISVRLSWCLWILSCIMILVTFYLSSLWNIGVMPRLIISASYDALTKLVWGLFLLWAVVSCAVERKGTFYDVMSWAPFSFFSRLIFPMAVISPTIVTLVFSYKKTHMYMSPFEIVFYLGGMILCTHVLAYGFHIFVESPFLQLTKMMRKTCGTKTFNSDKYTTGSSSYACEKVISEKLTNTKTQKDTREKCAV